MIRIPAFRLFLAQGRKGSCCSTDTRRRPKTNRELQQIARAWHRQGSAACSDERAIRPMCKVDRKLLAKQLRKQFPRSRSKLHKEIKQAKSWKHALHLLHSQNRRGVLACTAALSKCSYYWKHALLLLADFVPYAVERNTVTFNAATSACSKGRCWQGALYLHEELQRIALEADTISHNAVVSASDMFSQWKRAAASLVWMKRGTVVLESQPLGNVLFWLPS